MSSKKLPVLSGKQLISILGKDGWSIGRTANHGLCVTKQHTKCNSGKRVAFIPNKNESLPVGTLMAILGTKQTNIRKEGMLGLV